VMYFVLGLCLFSGADSMAPPGYHRHRAAPPAPLLRTDQAPTQEHLPDQKARPRPGMQPRRLHPHSGSAAEASPGDGKPALSRADGMMTGGVPRHQAHRLFPAARSCRSAGCRASRTAHREGP
jgi:hypothetical protein